MATEFDAEDLYESLPTASPTTHMLAGSFAGVMEHCVMYPVDSVKTRLQSLATETTGRRGVGSVLLTMMREEGLARPWRGMGAMAAGAGPAHALYFGSYEWLKVRFSSFTSASSANHDTLAQGAAAAVATCFHDGIMTPAEVVKQRLQMYNSPFRSMLDCVRQVYRIEGITAFYRSFTTQLLMNVPFQGVQFIVYERMQNSVNPDRSYNPLGHVISGGVAGALAAAVTTPLDVCKTLLNTQEAGALERIQKTQITGMLNSVKTVYRLGGMGGFFQGVMARVLYQAPSTAICWSVYEFFKYFLTKQGAVGRREGNGDYITYDIKDSSPTVRSSAATVNSPAIALPPAAARALV